MATGSHKHFSACCNIFLLNNGINSSYNDAVHMMDTSQLQEMVLVYKDTVAVKKKIDTTNINSITVKQLYVLVGTGTIFSAQKGRDEIN